MIYQLVRMVGVAAVLPVLTAAPVPGFAQSPQVADVVQGSIRPGWRTEEGTHIAALHLNLAQGWKTYWRAPGDAGIPPRFEWAGSHNIASVRIHWPRPIVFDQLGVRSIGYVEELVLPLEFTLRDDAAPARLETTVELGVCETICIPVTLRYQAELPAVGNRDAHIDRALAGRPEKAAGSAECKVEAIADGLRVTAAVEMPRIGADEAAVFELPDSGIWISEATTARDSGRLTAVADMVAPDGQPFALDRSALRITVLGEERAVELQGCHGR